MLDVIGKKWLYFLISGLVIVPGLISLILFGLRPSLDFTGGTLLEIKIPPPKEQKIKTEDIKKITESQKIEVGSIQPSEKDTYLLRLKPITQTENQKLQNALKKKYGPSVHQERIETVGAETTQKAILSVIVASLAIVAYIAFAFRGIPKPYSSLKFGVVAIAALIHDVLVVVGVFSLLGYFYKVEVDSLFITALLTVMGFSVHDTIVVFDRIRENPRKMAGQP